MKVVVMSRRRPNVCAKGSHKIFPSALVSIGEDDVDSYKKAGIPGKNLLIHPKEVVGICPSRNWILDNIEEETLVIVDDDCKGIACIVGERDVPARMIKEEKSIMMIFETLEQGAKEIGTGYFGIGRIGLDDRKFSPFNSFQFVGYSNSVHGIIGREFRFDEDNMVNDDIDFCLRMIRRYRVIFLDNRYSYVPMASTRRMAGGATSFLTKKRDKMERMKVKKRWGKYYQLGKWKFGEVTSRICVERKQKGLITPDML